MENLTIEEQREIGRKEFEILSNKLEQSGVAIKALHQDLDSLGAELDAMNKRIDEAYLELTKPF